MRTRAVARIVATLALIILGIGLALQPLQLPGFTAALSARYSESQAANLTAEQTADLAEQVRRYVVTGDLMLPEQYAGRPAFDAEMVSHLDDVREVIWAANLLTGMFAVLLAVWVGIAAAQGRLWDVATAFYWAAAVLAGAVVLLGAWALIDFDTFFTGFHVLFFEQGTWMFPYDSVLIRLFPGPFWAAAAGSWGVACVLVAGLYALAGVALRRRSRQVCMTDSRADTP